MEEILHHLGCIKPCKYWDIYQINWCRISDPSTVWHDMSNLALPPFRGCILNFQDAQLRQMLPRYAMPGEFPVLKILLEHLPSTLLPQKAWASCPENGIAFIFDIGGVHKSEKIGTSLLAIRSTCKRHQYHQSIKTLSSTSPFHFPRPFQAPLFEDRSRSCSWSMSQHHGTAPGAWGLGHSGPELREFPGLYPRSCVEKWHLSGI